MCYGQLGIKPWEMGLYTIKEIKFAIEGHTEQYEANYETLRRVAAAVVFSGNNKTLGKKFDKFFPPLKEKDKSAIKEQAEKIFKRLRENTALNKANEKLNAGRTKNNRK